MGSRIMHAIIANGIAEKLCIQDRTSFILGGVALMRFIQQKKRNFTLLRWHNENYTRRIAFNSFFQKYKAQMDSLFS